MRTKKQKPKKSWPKWGLNVERENAFFGSSWRHSFQSKIFLMASEPRMSFGGLPSLSSIFYKVKMDPELDLNVVRWQNFGSSLLVNGEGFGWVEKPTGFFRQSWEEIISFKREFDSLADLLNPLKFIKTDTSTGPRQMNSIKSASKSFAWNDFFLAV